MELEYFTEEPVSTAKPQAGAKGATQHYLYSKEENVVIQATPDGFGLRTELWLRSYLQTVLAGQSLPGFFHHGKVEVREDAIRPLIDGLSYKAYMEQKLTRINRALTAHGDLIMASIPSLTKAGMLS